MFSWKDFERRTDLDRFVLVRDNLPDGAIGRDFYKRRGNGNNEFPVVPMWNSLLAGVVFQHDSIASLTSELSREPSLLEACGFDPTPIREQPTIELKRKPDTNKGGQSDPSSVQSSVTAFPTPGIFREFAPTSFKWKNYWGIYRK